MGQTVAAVIGVAAGVLVPLPRWPAERSFRAPVAPGERARPRRWEYPSDGRVSVLRRLPPNHEALLPHLEELLHAAEMPVEIALRNVPDDTHGRRSAWRAARRVDHRRADPHGRMTVSTVDLDGLRRLLADRAQLVEVLPREEYAELHLPGAINIPLKQLTAESATQLNPARDVVVYCWDGL